ncbi:zinc finger RNA-binding protein 2 [Candoia aspera]|uniref:zinc finger RNA-binding protein 2 n=1 Tax=Candoia aspera TaxID=51853 RepID=UPI002FD7A11A
MAASNYYGFAAGAVAGPQYSPQTTPTYSHPPAAISYSVQQVPGTDPTIAPAYLPAVQAARPVAPAAYPGYQPSPTQDCGYGMRQPDPAPQPAQSYQDSYSYGQAPTAGSYEAKPYYQTLVTQLQNVATDSYHHTNAQSAYSQTQTQRQGTPVKLVQTGRASSSSYAAYPAPMPVSSVQSYSPSSYHSSPASYSGPNYSSYDAAAYTVANSSCYPVPPQPPPPPQPPKPVGGSRWGCTGSSSSSSSSANSPASGNYKNPLFPNKLPKLRGAPRQPQLHYCDICKISCAGPQTYREHLEGQKHTKREAALKMGNQPGGSSPRGVQAQLRCELCDVSCTGADAYVAHIRGAKHQKVLKLHTRLGKPIPSPEPVLVSVASAPANMSALKQALLVPSPAAPVGLTKPVVGVTNSTATGKMSTPKKSVAAKLPRTAASKLQAKGSLKSEEVKETQPKTVPEVEQLPLDGSGDCLGDLLDVQPVGQDYVEEVHKKGKMVRFYCRLCECSFNDPSAKDMHLKGRRHRLQYKKKVNPGLPVEIKPSTRARKLHEEKLTRHREEEQPWLLGVRRVKEEMYWRRVEEGQLCWEERRRRPLAADWPPPPLMGRLGVPVPPLLPARRPNSSDDRHIMTKHSSIYPTEEELRAIQNVVSHSEHALRLVSDWLVEQEAGKEEEQEEKGKTDKPPRVLKGVTRVGVLAKGLLLRGDRNVRLILLSAQKPTLALLQSVAEQLPKQLGKVTSDDYEVVSNSEEAHIVIASSREPKMQVTVSLTSPLMRGDPTNAEASAESQQESSEILNKDRCLESLAALRHAKWFQARANSLQSCVIIIRVLRDLCQRVPTWGALPDWVMELLVERTLSTALGPLGPGEAMRRVLEYIATGMLLADGPGLPDPCEKEPVDALQSMAQQAREDVTASGQHALRMLAFRQIHKVLGMEPLPFPKNRPGTFSRKRRRDTDEEAQSEGDRKKDKKEDEGDGSGA